ncbi:hypothetical protein BKA65DRAFT_561623 [Rhexocercosporidium sp. MPI-PUGE-AT-0058]|nr:hypothetical protein BKA65DRAFT_561623 [Rhexocercosporidium sp. MPI-PUGE-AT-0058]
MPPHQAANNALGDSTSTLRSLVETLPEEYQREFRKCTTGEEVLNGLQEYGANWRTNSHRLGVFIQAMKPFLTAVDVFVQCDPIHAGTLWGGLRVVIQLGQNFTEFLDKLTSSLEKIAWEIKYFVGVNDVIEKLNDKHQKEMEAKVNLELQKKVLEGIGTVKLEELKPKLLEEMRTAMMAAVQADWQRLVETSPRLKAVLYDVFRELVQYFLGIFKIFYYPDGRSKNGLRVFAKAVWKPFRFDDTLARLAMYRERVLPEMALLNLKVSSNVKSMVESSQVRAMEDAAEANARNARIGSSLNKLDEKAEREAHYNFIHRVREWLSPPPFADRYDDAASQCSRGTSGWLLEHPSYLAWLQNEENSHGQAKNLWVRGNPGSGKTVLAASVVQDLKQDEAKTPICYYFFNSTQKTAVNDSDTAYRALLSQILEYHIHDERLNELFRFAMFFQATGQCIASKKEVSELLEFCVSSIGRTRVVVDALDECEDIAELVSKLHRIGSLVTIQLALFSRPTMTLLARDVPSLETVTIGWLNTEDINLYLFRALEEMKLECLLSPSSDSIRVAETLTRRADGMFLWARLMVVYLKSPGLYPGERQQAISELDSPEGLDVMYERILHLIERGGKSLRRLARGSFLWILYGRRLMMPSELESALAPYDTVLDNKESWQLPDFEDTVILACAGFVEQSPQVVALSGGTFHPFQFIHASVKEFMISQAMQGSSASVLKDQILPPRIEIAEAYLATTCLKYLMYRVPAQPLGGNLGTYASYDDIWAAFPFSNYAMLNWTSHLAATGQKHLNKDGRADGTDAHGVLHSTLEMFLKQPEVLMAWIEGCYTYGESPPASYLRAWGAMNNSTPDRGAASTDLGKIQGTAAAFGDYLETLENDWGQSLQKNPAILWDEVVAFTPSPLLLKHTGISVKGLRPNPPSKTGLCQDPINFLSQLTPDGTHQVFLSIYPSKKFEQHSKRTDTARQVFEDRSLSSGWMLRYEILQISSENAVASLEIQLPEFEVWMRLCETLLRESVQIPICIARSCQVFSVMRTVYHIRNTNNRLVCVSRRLPVESESMLGVSPKASDGKNGTSDKKLSEINYKDTGRFRNNRRANIRLYWIYLDDSGENLCYATQERPLPNSLKVFRISVCTDENLRLEMELVAERSFWTHDITSKTGEEGKDFEMCFHPFLPVVVYAWSKGTYVWNIVTKKCVKAGYGSFQIASLTCSQTGSSCILSPRDHRPEIIPLVQAMKETGISDIPSLEVLSESGGTSSAPQQEVAPDMLQASTTPWTLAHAILGPKKVLTNSIVTLTPNGSFNHISVLNVGRSAVLSQWHDDGEDDSMTLSRIPNWRGAESAIPSVILPSCELEPIRVVFDKSADTWSKVSAREPSTFPLMIDRDMSSFPVKPSSFVQLAFPRMTHIKELSQQSIEYHGGASNDEDYQGVEEETTEFQHGEAPLKRPGFRRLRSKFSGVKEYMTKGRKRGSSQNYIDIQEMSVREY